MKEKSKLKVMHTVSKDGNGNPTIHSVVTNPPKLKEAVEPKTKTVSKPPEKEAAIMTDEQRAVLKALNDLGGEQHSMTIAKKLGWDKKFDAPRGHVRNACDRLAELHFVTSKKQGIKYAYAITDKGKEALKDKGAHNPAPASTASSGSNHQQPAAKSEAKTVSAPPERPANTDIQCSKCQTWNPYMAEFCKNCGQPLKVKAAPVAA